MAGQGPPRYWGDRYRPFVPAWESEEEFRALVDAIVRGAWVCHASVPNLRKLIEAVQAHPEATLAPPADERGDDWKPPRSNSKDALTHVAIYGGECVGDEDCQARDIRISFTLGARFCGDVRLNGTSFGGDASFGEARFDGTSEFGEARFGGGASFKGARFIGSAVFNRASFGGAVLFNAANFYRKAQFDGAMFGGDASFRWARFGGVAVFSGARIGGVGEFRGVSFSEDTLFGEARFAGNAGFEGAMFGRGTSFVGTSFMGAARFGGAHFDWIGTFVDASFGGDASFTGASFREEAAFGGARFGGNASFDGASFGGETAFGGTSFGGDASFTWASFGGETAFDGVSVGGEAAFNGVSFGGVARLNGVSFGGTVSFGRARFGEGAFFSEASFGECALFNRTRFGGDAWFSRVRFSGVAAFDEASFCGDAQFSGVGFGGDARFNGVSFGGAASFRRALFDGARFTGDVVGDLRPCFVRTATFAPPNESGPPGDGRARSAWRWVRYEFGWGSVRALGQLQILNRISVVALIAVPVLAALTAVLQAQFEHWPSLGHSLALAFFAAAFVTLGLLIYQIFAPDHVRKHDEDAYIDLRHARYPEKAEDRDDGLRRAIEHLEEIAKRRPDRHKSFVSHHGETIWIPPRDRIEWFEDWQPPAKANDAGSDDAASSGPAAQKMGPSADETAQRESDLRMGLVPGAERRRITIEEGARAEYRLKSREKVGWAWASFILYLCGIGCLLVIIGLQSHRVGEAAGWWGAAEVEDAAAAVLQDERVVAVFAAHDGPSLALRAVLK